MMQEYMPSAELRDLVDALCNDTASERQVRALENFLRDDVQARLYYLDQMALHARMRWLIRSKRAARSAVPPPDLADTSASPSPILGFLGSTTQFLHNPIVFSVVALVAVGLAIGLGMLALREASQGPIAKTPATGNGPIVAKVSAVDQCVWPGGASSLAPGMPLRDGQQIRLAKGLLQITYMQGVKSILQGPAALRMAANGGFLEFGRFSAQVPDGVDNFAVHTDTAKVVDLGTEFGIRAEKKGKTEVYTFDGTVEVTPGGSKTKAPVRLEAGKGKKVESSGATSDITEDRFALGAEQFVRTLRDFDLPPMISEDTPIVTSDFSHPLDARWRILIGHSQQNVQVANGLLEFSSTVNPMWARHVVLVPGQWNDQAVRVEIDVRVLGSYSTIDRVAIAFYADEDLPTYYNMSPSGNLNLLTLNSYRKCEEHVKADKYLEPMGGKFPHAGSWWRMALEKRGHTLRGEVDLDRDGTWDYTIGPWEVPLKYRCKPNIIGLHVGSGYAPYRVQMDNLKITKLDGASVNKSNER